VELATASPPRAEAHERVELYLYSPSWALRACYRVNLYLYSKFIFIHSMYFRILMSNILIISVKATE
jgi:hypothetical protein